MEIALVGGLTDEFEAIFGHRALWGRRDMFTRLATGHLMMMRVKGEVL